MTVPVTVVTGFLGAGKSTLVDAWLRELGASDTALIINEVGEVGLDADLLAGRTRRVREIAGGCVCCSTQSELASALVALADDLGAASAPRILVETSGAASPAGVVGAIQSTGGRARLDGILTVVDASRLDWVLGFDLALEQLGFADAVVLSHADRCDAISLERAEARLASLAAMAPLARSNHRAAPPLVPLLHERAKVLREPSSDSAHTPFESIAMTVDGALDEERFGDFIEVCIAPVGARIVRLKAIIAMAGVEQRVIVHGVADDIAVLLGEPWTDAERRLSRLVILGLGLDALDRDALAAHFAACAA
ncbi:MAG: GTP-binding protein [Myxococcota bacterium]